MWVSFFFFFFRSIVCNPNSALALCFRVKKYDCFPTQFFFLGGSCFLLDNAGLEGKCLSDSTPRSFRLSNHSLLSLCFFFCCCYPRSVVFLAFIDTFMMITVAFPFFFSSVTRCVLFFFFFFESQRPLFLSSSFFSPFFKRCLCYVDARDVYSSSAFLLPPFLLFTFFF